MKIINIILLVIIGILSSKSFGQFEIDTSLKVDESFESLMPNVSNEKIYFAVLKKDKSNNVIEKNFLQKWNGKYANWRIHFQYNSENLLVKEWKTDTLNNIVEAVVCDAPMTKYKYDQKGRQIEVACFSNDTTPTYHDCSHYHKKSIEYDDNDNIIFTQLIGLNDIVQKTQSFKFDQKNRIIEINLLDEKRKIIRNRPSILIIKYDDKNREIENRYLNWDRKPIKEKEKTSHETYEYQNGYVIITYFNYKNKVLKKVKRSGSEAAYMEEEVKD